jgi:hypothetical protein
MTQWFGVCSVHTKQAEQVVVPFLHAVGEVATSDGLRERRNVRLRPSLLGGQGRQRTKRKRGEERRGEETDRGVPSKACRSRSAQPPTLVESGAGHARAPVATTPPHPTQLDARSKRRPGGGGTEDAAPGPVGWHWHVHPSIHPSIHPSDGYNFPADSQRRDAGIQRRTRTGQSASSCVVQGRPAPAVHFISIARWPGAATGTAALGPGLGFLQ